MLSLINVISACSKEILASRSMLHTLKVTLKVLKLRFDVFVYLLDWRNICILAHMHVSFIEVNFQFPSREGKCAKLLPATASTGSLLHLCLHIYSLRVYESTHSILHSMSTILLHCAD